MFFLIDLVGAVLVIGFVTAIYMAAAPGPRRRPTTSDVGGTVLPFAAGVLLAAWAGGAWLPSGPSSAGTHWLSMAVFGTLGALVFAALLPMPPRHRASLGPRRRRRGSCRSRELHDRRRALLLLAARGVPGFGSARGVPRVSRGQGR